MRMRLLPRFLPSGVFQRHTQRLSALRAQHPSNRCKRFTQLALENYNCMSPKAQTTGLKRAVTERVTWWQPGCCGGALMPPARGAPHLRTPQPIRSSSNKHSHPNIPRQCPVTRSAAVPRVSRAFQLRARAAGGKTCATYLPCVLLYSWAWRERGKEGRERRRREEEGGTPCARATSPHGSLFLRSRRRTFFSARFKCGWPDGSAACHMTTASRAQSIAFRISPACS